MQDLKEEIKRWKDEFVQIYTENITREGADKLLAYLESSDFFTSPASTKHHNAFEGGLVNHSVNVYKRFRDSIKREGFDLSDESIAICSLLHDVCKINGYVVEMRNVKEGNEWLKKPYYAKNTADLLPYGHGEKSVYMLSSFIKLTREEAIGINWHMGPFDDRCKTSFENMSAAFKLYPSAVLLHQADMAATYFDENRE